MGPVAKKSTHITRLPEVVTVMALHVYGCTAQEATLDKGSHAPSYRAELIVMPHCDLAPPLIGECDQLSGLGLINCEWLLDIDVASTFETNSRNVKMAIRRSRDMNNIWLSITQKLHQVAKIAFDRESFVQLSRHQRLPVIDANDFASADPLDLRRVRVCNSAASDDGDFKQAVLSPGSFQNTAPNRPPWTPLVSSPPASSFLCCCNASSSNTRATSCD